MDLAAIVYGISFVRFHPNLFSDSSALFVSNWYIRKNSLMKLSVVLFSLLLVLGCSSSPDADPNQQEEEVNSQTLDIQGHRGARGYLPENSIPGFVLAMEMGANTLEMDLCCSADSQLVVNHDPILNASLCLDAAGNELPEDLAVFSLPMETIRSIDCGSQGNSRFPEQKAMPVSRPALWEVLDVTEKLKVAIDSSDVNYNIEIKFRDDQVGVLHPDAETFVGLVLKEINAFGIEDRTTLQSFSAVVLEEINKQAPSINTSWLVEDNASVEEHLNRISFIPDVYSPYHLTLTKEKIEAMHSHGIKVIPWTVNDAERMKALIEMGVDGIISDYPDRAVSAKTNL